MIEGSYIFGSKKVDINQISEVRNASRENFIFDDVEEMTYDSQDGFGVIHALQMYLEPYPSVEAIVLNCNDYFENSGYQKDLSVSVNPEDYAYFLINEAYK